MAQHANRSCSVRGNQSKNLLTDEVPSFSLGLTQDEVFNLGSTNVFSNKGVTIEELRSKHRKDSEKIVEIMKRKGLTKTSSPTKFQKSVKRKKSDEKGECSKIASPVASDSESEQEKVEELYECCSNVPRNVASKVDSQIPRILNWKTNSPRPRYETLMGSMFDDTDDKVIFKNIEPTRKEISAFHIPKKLVPGSASHNKDDIDSDDDFQDPPQRQNHSEDEDGVVSKKVFDKFCEKVWQEFNDIRGLVSSRFDQMMNAINENKVAEEMARYQSNSMNDVYNEIDGCNEDNDIILITKSVDESIGDAQISESQLTFSDDVLRSIDLDSIAKTNVEVEDEFKNTLLDELLPSLNVYANLERSIIVHPSPNQAQQTPMHVSRIRRPSRYNESPFTMKFGSADVNAIEDTKITNKFMTWLSLDLLKYHLKRNNKEEHYLKKKAKILVINFEILSVEDKNWFYVMVTPSQTWSDEDDATLNASGVKYHLNESVSGFRMHATVSWHTVDHMFIPVHVKAKHHWVLAVISFNHRCIYVYDFLSAAGHDAAVLTEIEKLAKDIPICLIECKFYENKGIDIDNHPNYKLNDKMDPFGVSIVENVPQQPSGSLDCGLYMVTYVKCLTFGEAVPCIDFDPDLIRIRYASLLWDYGTRKANAKAQSDDEAPMRPLRITELTEGTEVVDI
ncbi:hypothetical protein FXO38_00282 [Capsicum annuum]|nr:hypothetical protein FXO38_00282 [Capsicum annuum]